MTWTAKIVRRPRLGRTSAREIARMMTPAATVHRVDRPPPIGQFDIAIRWGCTNTVPEQRVLNSAEAIHAVNDKVAFRKLLEPTNLCPKTWFDFDDVPYDRLSYVLENDVIIRPSRHAQGRRLWVCHTYHQMMRTLTDPLDNEEYYISQLIPKTHEYRVFIVQGRVAWVARKTPGNPQDVAWNVARGGRFDNVRWSDWPLQVVRYACEAFALTSLDFGGVDVMYDSNASKSYVLEINSAPSQTSPYRQQAAANCFSYIMQRENKERIPMVESLGGYRKFIHPALTNEALMV